MSDAITKAVIALEKQHGVTSIMELSDQIVKKWRKDHERLFKENKFKSPDFVNNNDLVDEIYLKTDIDGTEYLSQLDIKPLIMAPSKTTIQTNKVIYMEIAESMLKGNLQAKDIAKDIGSNVFTVNYHLSEIKNKFYYYVLSDGRLFKANKMIELEETLLSNGINFKPQYFYNYLSRHDGYARFRNGNAYARVFIQYQITPVTLMDDNGKIIKEV